MQTARNGTQAEAKAAIDHVLLVLNRIELGMSRSNFVIDPLHAEEDTQSVIRASYCLKAQFNYAKRFGTPKDLVTQSARMLHFGTLVSQDVDLQGGDGNYVEIHVRLALARLISSFNANLYQQIVASLYKYDIERDPLENRLYYQRLADENRGWLKHLKILMKEWSGKDPYAWKRQQYLNNHRHLRMLTVQFSLQRYFLDNNRLLEKLTE